MITLKQAAIEDLNQLVEIFDAYRVWYRMSSDLSTAHQFLQERITNKESVIYLAYDENRAVAFTQVYPLFSSTRMKRLWLLNDLFVDEKYRGQGISKQLINAVKQLAQDTNSAGVLLETEKSNSIGNLLYPAMGFKLENNNFYFWTNQ